MSRICRSLKLSRTVAMVGSYLKVNTVTFTEKVENMRKVFNKRLSLSRTSIVTIYFSRRTNLLNK